MKLAFRHHFEVDSGLIIPAAFHSLLIFLTRPSSKIPISFEESETKPQGLVRYHT